MNVSAKTLWFEIKTDGADELFKVKQLPGREYDDTRGVWVVPMKRGLARRFADLFPEYPSIVAIVEEREAGLMETLKAPGLTVAQLHTISAREAIERAHAWREAVEKHGGKP